MVAETLREGFVLAHRRYGLILLDVIWKLVWFALTACAVVIVVYQFVSHFSFTPINIQAFDALRLAGSVRELWNDYGGEFLGGIVAVLGMSGLVYLLLEAKVRARLARAGCGQGWRGDKGFSINGSGSAQPGLMFFLGSNLLKLLILGSSAVILGMMSGGSADGRIAALVVFCALAFFLTILDTLLRSDAIGLLGIDFLGVTGLIGTLLLFEALMHASLVVVLIAGYLNVGSAREALEMFVVTGLVLLICNFLHSYLLLVRFSAVGIMRRNVSDV